MNNIEKIIDILLDNNDLNLSVDQCEQIAELLDDNGIGDLQKSKKEINSCAAVAAANLKDKLEIVDTYEITTVLFDDFAAKNLDVVDLLADAIDNKYPQMDQKYMIFGKYINRGKNAKGEHNEV